MTPVAVYVHTPFCPTKCGYCDFNSYAMSGEVVGRTVEAIATEIRRTPWAGRPAKTIFFGGGTPTFLETDHLLGLLRAVQDVHPPVPGVEITSEANPGTVDASKFDAMRAAGFNRISLGAQSFVPEDLVRLGRVHRSGEIGRAVHAARRAGFERVNVDLMFALPGQSLRAWDQNLDLALGLGPDHLSLYCLTIEPNTRYHKLHSRGMLHIPDDAQQVTMYDRAVERCESAGLAQYEISNFARPGQESAHNLCYWRCEEYLAYGPGAVGCHDVGGGRVRYTNLKHPERYSAAVEAGTPLAFESEVLDEAAQRLERIMMGLRLNEGLRSPAVSQDSLEEMRRRGWVRGDSDWIALTPAGRHFCSEVALALA